MSAQQMASAVGEPSDQRRLNPEIFAMLVLGGAVLASAILGILLRPVGNLSAFGPANAVLLGLLVSFPRIARAGGWAAAAAASPRGRADQAGVRVSGETTRWTAETTAVPSCGKARARTEMAWTISGPS